MITARIGTSILDLPEQFSFEIVKNSQLFNFEKLKGDFIPNIEFEDTERNRNLLNYPNRFELQRDGSKEYKDFELRCNGFILIKGTLVIEDKLSGYVKGAIGNIKSSQIDKKIPDLFRKEGFVTFQNKNNYDPLTDDYCCPTITNEYFFKDLSEPMSFESGEETYEESILQHYHRNRDYQINIKNDGYVSIPNEQLSIIAEDLPKNTFIGSTYPVTPMLYLFPAIEKMLKKVHYFKKSSEITDSDLLGLVIYNNKSIVNLIPHVKTTEEITSWWDWRKQEVSVLDYYDQGLTNFYYKELLPKITLKDLIISVQNLLNISFVFGNDDTYRIKDREGIITGPATDVSEYFTESWIMKGKVNQTLKFTINMDPSDAEISTFYQDLSERESDFKDDVADMNALMGILDPEVGELRRVISLRRIFEYGTGTLIDKNGNERECLRWNYVSLDYQPVKYSNGEGSSDILEISTNAGTVPYTNLNGTVKQLGRNNLRRDTEAGFGLRLLFSNQGWGSNHTTKYLLNFHYENNLLETRWKHTAKWLSSREAIEGYFRFPLNIFVNLDIDKKMRTRQGHFIVDKMVTKFSHTGIGETKIEGWKA